MTNAEMWQVWEEAAAMLDAPGCDWRVLQQIEEILSLLACELERAAEVSTRRPHVSPASHGAPALLLLQTSLAWVRQHEYDALESELENHLGTALRCAAGTLDRLEWRPSETQVPCCPGNVPGDRR